MEIVSNGSKWAGQEPNSLEVLLDVLKHETLDPSFEEFGGFVHLPTLEYDKEVRCHGNFLTVSHVFDIRGTEEELRPLIEAIKANRASKAYQADLAVRLQARAELRHAACNRYVNLIRNKTKREYGWAYLHWLLNHGVGPEPERPKGLSVMGAQAVRIAIGEITNHEPFSICAV